METILNTQALQQACIQNQRNILLVDDDFSTLVAIKACLEKRHFTVYQSHIQYHLCILTSKMPGYSDLLKLQPKWCNPKTHLHMNRSFKIAF